jgi:DNA-binding transcriptional ArsR family regulator
VWCEKEIEVCGGPMSDKDATDNLLAALHHPVRRKILLQIAGQDGPTTPRGLAEGLGMPLSNVSYHARVLVACEFLELVDTQPKRGSIQHFYEPSKLVEHPMVKEALGLGGDDGAEV